MRKNVKRRINKIYTFVSEARLTQKKTLPNKKTSTIRYSYIKIQILELVQTIKKEA